ncbi:hypothetical protein HHA04nite_05910 [Halomonas halophila]|uniref:PBP domain-containing protein n=2 Tax=Halomonadaceae TaxID=28256 RepID=A0ABQ0U125_9GAMM|nr:hypothetical protein [Halomonas sp. HG01]GEK72047.1 hypothetical protein HHA04nite_05910 [Halomonas halophila]
MLRRVVMAIGLALLSVAPWVAADQGDDDEAQTVLLVAHPDVTTQSLTRDITRALFAMRQRTWPNGQAARIFVLPNRHPVHARFVKQRLSVYPHQLQLAWDRAVFSGTGQAPERVSTQAEMLERIADTPGALGYLEREKLDDRVQVITME